MTCLVKLVRKSGYSFFFLSFYLKNNKNKQQKQKQGLNVRAVVLLMSGPVSVAAVSLEVTQTLQCVVTYVTLTHYLPGMGVIRSRRGDTAPHGCLWQPKKLLSDFSSEKPTFLTGRGEFQNVPV